MAQKMKEVIDWQLYMLDYIQVVVVSLHHYPPVSVQFYYVPKQWHGQIVKWKNRFISMFEYGEFVSWLQSHDVHVYFCDHPIPSHGCRIVDSFVTVVVFSLPSILPQMLGI